MNKKKRQDILISIISEKDIGTQDDLTEELIKNGCDATQATISRDIKELGIIKRKGKNGKYKYTYMYQPSGLDNNGVFVSSAIRCEAAGHIVCVKCYTGMANAACAVLDMMDHENTVGTIAGDDTIFILMKSEKDANALALRLNTMIGR
jgi:transcriptional regulator of arginine metabolism